MQNHETIGMGSILSWFALSLCGFTVPAVTQHLRHDRHLRHNTGGANQVGEMFANYNLIAALAAFFYHYWQNIRVENSRICCIGMRRTWSYVIYFIQEPTASLWNGFQ
jgi:maltose/moltooligosaccharide transporter